MHGGVAGNEVPSFREGEQEEGTEHEKKDRAVQLKDECNNLEALLLCQYCINF